MRKALERDLQAAGIDTRVMFNPASDDDKPRPRFRFLTWGQETAINDHSDCPNVVFAGVIHRSETDLAAAIVGRQDDLLAKVPATQLVEVRRSENAHALYQAMSRGACRETMDGQAEPMRVWLIHYDKQLPGLIGDAWGEVGDLDTKVPRPDPDQGGGAGSPGSRLSSSSRPGYRQGIDEGVETNTGPLRHPRSDLHESGSTGGRR